MRMTPREEDVRVLTISRELYTSVQGDGLSRRLRERDFEQRRRVEGDMEVTGNLDEESGSTQSLLLIPILLTLAELNVSTTVLMDVSWAVTNAT